MPKHRPHIEIYPDTAGQYRWRFRAANGVIIASSGEGFITKSNCHDSVVTFIAAAVNLLGILPHVDVDYIEPVLANRHGAVEFVKKDAS